MSAHPGGARERMAAEAKVLPFRRPAGAVRVRRRHLLRTLLAPLTKALALVGTPLAAGFWLFGSPTFALHGVEVDGNRRV